MIDALNPFIQQVVTLKGSTAVVVFLIMLGYVLKMSHWFPNRFIPLVNFLVGPLLTPILVAWIMHTKFLRKFIDEKIPALNPGRHQEKTKTIETHVTPEGEKKTVSEQAVTVDVDPAPKDAGQIPVAGS